MTDMTKAHFLIVDDDDIDIMNIKRILINIDKDISFSVCHDGVEALDTLRQKHKDAQDFQKVIVLLDLNMPKMNGHEFLEELRQDTDLKQTIVFVLSTSTDSRDVSASYDKVISGYIPKDKITVENFRSLFEVYLDLVTIPDAQTK